VNKATFHREIGAYARGARLSHLYGLGNLSQHAVEAFGPGGGHAASLDGLLALVRERDRPGTTLLVKGSRFMRMERVVTALGGSEEGEGGPH
jgi:UDP-N-acetylmuramoyl-tripeptide--D-alanyl-D-alanine ligase